MPRVVFTPHLRRHVECPEQTVEAETVRQSLEAVFAKNERLRGYVLDDRNRLRQHVVIFVDGMPVTDRVHLSDRVSSESEVYVMQALSGG